MPALTRRELLAAAGLAAAGVAASCARTPAPPETAWKDLEQRLHGSLVRLGDPDYEQLSAPRNLRFAATKPEAVVLCANPADIAAAVVWSRKTNTPFAIRGGATIIPTARSHAASSSARAG